LRWPSVWAHCCRSPQGDDGRNDPCGAIPRADHAHGPVAELHWTAMTMGFDAIGNQLNGLKVGDKVSFSFRWAGKAGEVESINKIWRRQPPHSLCLSPDSCGQRSQNPEAIRSGRGGSVPKHGQCFDDIAFAIALLAKSGLTGPACGDVGGGVETFETRAGPSCGDRVADAYVQGHPAQRRPRLSRFRFRTPGSNAGTPHNPGRAAGCLQQIDGCCTERTD